MTNDRMRTWKNALLIWNVYRASSFGVRFRVLVRFLICPYERFLQTIPKTGRILDVGCGDGQLLYWLLTEPNTNRTGIGIDHDEKKISNAALALKSHAEFRTDDITGFPPESMNAVCISHVMYLIPLETWPKILEGCFRVLKKGGTFVLMESVGGLSWKSKLAHLQEMISVYVTRMTKGEIVSSHSVETYRSAIQKAGGPLVHVDVQRADDGFIYPHVLFVARKP